MPLNEISLKKEIDALHEPASILANYGWQVLGSGLSGAVAQHPNKPYVLKLFKKDPGYLKFIQFIQENLGNEHLPKINRTIKTVPGTHLFYVRMERLQPISERELWNKFTIEMIYMSLLAIKNDLVIASSTEDKLRKELTKKHLNQHVLRRVNFDDVYVGWYAKPSASWIDISKKLIDFSDNNNVHHLDIHSDNFMLRDQTLVITDPF